MRTCSTRRVCRLAVQSIERQDDLVGVPKIRNVASADVHGLSPLIINHDCRIVRYATSFCAADHRTQKRFHLVAVCGAQIDLPLRRPRSCLYSAWRW